MAKIKGYTSDIQESHMREVETIKRNIELRVESDIRFAEHNRAMKELDDSFPYGNIVFIICLIVGFLLIISCQ